MPYFILGIALLVGLILLVRGFAAADPKVLARVLKWTAAILLLMLVFYLAYTRRLGLMIAALAFLIPLFMRWRSLANVVRGFGGPSAGQRSDVETAYLRMSLDHDSGEVEGTVLAGKFQGRRLSELSPAELMELLAECRVNDEQSAGVLEAYLDRTAGPDWRAGADAGSGSGQEESGGGRRSRWGRGAGSSQGAMTREEAYEVLGLKPGASEKEIKEAHHRLMREYHPDHGGSTYLAAKINEAKDLLLGG